MVLVDEEDRFWSTSEDRGGSEALTRQTSKNQKRKDKRKDKSSQESEDREKATDSKK